MRRIIIIIVICAFATATTYSQDQNTKIKLSKSFGQLALDSSLRIDKGVFYYRLLLRTSNTTHEIYRVKNRDHSLEFKRKFLNKGLNYVCYEAYDLPTGVTWNVLYQTTSNKAYITNHYDMHAMGDELIASSVNFLHKTAMVMSFETKKPYRIKLIKVWPM